MSPVGRREVIWSSAQNLTAITDTDTQLLITTTLPRWTPTLRTSDGCTGKAQTPWITHKCMHRSNFHDINGRKSSLRRHQSSWLDLLWLVSASGSRWPSWATLVIQCPEPLPPPAATTTKPNCTAEVSFAPALQQLSLLWLQVHSTLWLHRQLVPLTPGLWMLLSSLDK